MGGVHRPVGTVRHAGCNTCFNNPRLEPPVSHIMHQTFVMTDLRKRVLMLALLCFVALC